MGYQSTTASRPAIMSNDFASRTAPVGPPWTIDPKADAVQVYSGDYVGTRDRLMAIRKLTESAACDSPLDEISAVGFEMAVDELCSNVVEHGYGDAAPLSPNDLAVSVARFKDRIECLVTDCCEGHFCIDDDHAREIDDALAAPRHRGLGLDIIRHAVDKIECQRLSPRGNQTRLTLYFNA
jgi:anti-sigma regulatory factor (Ser/Thr protein kinase)